MPQIIARINTDEQRRLVRQVFPDLDEEKAFWIGEADDASIERLRREGISVLTLPIKESAVWGAGDSIPAETDIYKIQLLTPLLNSYQETLDKILVRLLRRLPEAPTAEGDPGTAVREWSPDYYTAYLTGPQVTQLSQLPFIGTITRYGLEDTEALGVTTSLDVPENSVRPFPGARGITPQMKAGKYEILRMEAGEYEILLHRPEGVGGTLRWLRNRDVAVRSATSHKIRARLPDDVGLLRQICDLTEVKRVERYLPPELHTDYARKLLGLETPSAAGGTIELDQKGAGQIVGIADTGIDDRHPDFGARIVGLVAHGRPGDTSDPDGHGTHVAGCIVGDGSASGGAIRGVAPKAELFMQSLLDSAGNQIGGLTTTDLGNLFAEAYRQRVRIHNNSWGVNAAATYRSNSEELDRFVAEHRDMLIVCSAGNYGTARNPLYANAGYVDWYSVGAPATNKNGITVGACRTDRTAGPSATITHGTKYSADFPAPPIAKEAIAGNAEGLFGASSRGPCRDFRIKPDVVVPGTDILSTLSGKATATNPPFWGAYPADPHYAYCGGTSMAAPLVAGCAALVREYYVNLPGIKVDGPSAALLKATLINSTRWLNGTDAVTDHPEAGNMHQGFGRVYMPYAIPNKVVPWLKLEWVDNWTDPSQQLAQTGDMHLFRIVINGGGEFLRFCLAYTDREGASLQNNINLTVELPDGSLRRGNDRGYHVDPIRYAKGFGDDQNNVEIVRMEKPAAGRYTAQIVASNLLDKPHDYALVVTGDLAPGIEGRLTKT